APALEQGIDLLHASPEIADRVLVVFTDGEAHDSLEPTLQEAHRLAGLGIHLILVAEGGREPTKIPMRDDRGALLGWQQDGTGNPVQTSRRDDVLGAVADAAQGTIVAAELPDQAAAVRDLVASYKRATATEALAAGDPALARSSLARAAASLDPELRFRALYNLGLLALLQARSDSASRDAHLADAERAYREALLLQPHHIRAKWNLELVSRLRGAGGQADKPNPPPPPSPGGGGGGGGAAGPQQQPAGQSNNNSGGLSEDQADQVLQSIGQEELRTRRDRTGRSRRAAPAGIKDW